MKLNQLLYFCRACDNDNISHAAEELHISQPTISMAIRDLENEFGITLIQRNNKGFTLTREGQYFYEKTKIILSQTNKLEQIMLDMGNRRKHIQLGIPPMIGTFLFPQLYQGFRTIHPDIELSSYEGGTTELVRLLDDNKLDFAIVTSNHIPEKHYQILPLMETETVFCIRSDHPLAKKKTISMKELISIPLIMFHESYSQSRLVEERFSQANCHSHIIYRSGQLYTIKEFITRGIAAGFLFRELADAIPNITGICLTDPLRIQIGLIWKPGQSLFNDAVAFLKYAKQYMKK